RVRFILIFYFTSHSLFFSLYVDHLDLHSFPTRRSSDLINGKLKHTKTIFEHSFSKISINFSFLFSFGGQIKKNEYPHNFVCINSDRKSTRLNSSHVKISYAVFCLKKKKINRQ